MRQKNPLADPLDDSTPTDFRRLGLSRNEQDKPRGTYGYAFIPLSLYLA